MKIKKEHLLKTLIVKGKKYLLGELEEHQVKQFNSAGYIPNEYVEKTTKKKKYKGIKEDGAEVQGTVVKSDNGDA